MGRYFLLVGLNVVLFFGAIWLSYLAEVRGSGQVLRLLTDTLLFCLSPLAVFGRLNQLSMDAAVAILVSGPFIWAGIVESILRRFVDSPRDSEPR